MADIPEQATRTTDGKFAAGRSGNPRGRKPRAKTAATPGEQLAHITAGPPGSPGGGGPATVADAWSSMTTGIGTGDRDKRLTHDFAVDNVAYSEAIALWTGDDIAKRAIEAVPNECMREGYEINISDDPTGLQEWLERQIKRLGVDEAIRITHCRERAFGGGGILIGANDGRTYDQPLDIASVTSLDFVTPFEPIVMRPIYYYNRASSPRYGEPSHYQISPMTMGASIESEQTMSNVDRVSIVHESRVIAFGGIRVSAYQPLSGTAGWGYSMLTRIRHILRDFQVACASAGILAADFSQAIFAMEGLAKFASENNIEALRNRLAAIEIARSTARAVLIDIKEKFERQTTNIQGLPELLAWLSSRLAAAVEMPLTLLMGQSPKGLGNEGDSDIRFYYDQVAGVQKHKIEPALRRIISILMRTRVENNRVEPKKWEIKFHPLWQLSDKERAESQYTQAQADAIYVDMGALTNQEIRDQRFGGEFSYETNVTRVTGEDPDPIAPTDPATLAAMGYGAPDPLAPVAAVPVAPAAPGAAPIPVAPKAALSGPQVASMLSVIVAANASQITRPQAIAMLGAAFQLEPATAASLLGPEPAPPAPVTPTPPPAPPPPAAPPAPQGTPAP